MRISYSTRWPPEDFMEDPDQSYRVYRGATPSRANYGEKPVRDGVATGDKLCRITCCAFFELFND